MIVVKYKTSFKKIEVKKQNFSQCTYIIDSKSNRYGGKLFSEVLDYMKIIQSINKVIVLIINIINTREHIAIIN